MAYKLRKKKKKKKNLHEFLKLFMFSLYRLFLSLFNLIHEQKFYTKNIHIYRGKIKRSALIFIFSKLTNSD